MNQYVAGTLVRLAVAVTATVGGAPVAPSAIALSMRTPDGKVSSITPIVTDGTGLYHVDYLTAMPGLHEYEWLCTGTVQVASLSQFLVTAGTV